MTFRARLDKLERTYVPITPALLYLTPEGLRDGHNQAVSPEAVGNAKVIVGLDPREL